MKTTQEFERLYRGLNKAQKKAVDTIDGPVMVVAGPGTGKTTILTLRIANILRLTDTEPEQILALTFTESGVNSMRKKLSGIIGTSAYRIHINTFHGFSNEVIRLFPDEFPRIIGGDNATEIDQIQIIEDILDGGEFSLLRPYGDPRYYVRHVLNAIRNLKRDNVSPTEFLSLVEKEKTELESREDLYHKKGAHSGKMRGEYAKQEKYIKKNEELARVYREYESGLREKGLYDFEDMIIEAVNKIESDEQFRLILQEEYQYILADEHQDANNAQNKLLELLSSFFESPNLFIVGDEKQAIFRFQGASLENFLYFKDKYPDVTLIALTDNYRSTQVILDSSHSLIESDDGDTELRAKLVSKKQLIEKNIQLNVFSKPVFEYMFLSEEIRSLLEKGVEASNIAILYRDNKDVLDLARHLSKTDIPFQIESDMGLLSDEDMRKLIAILRAVENPTDTDLLVSLLSIDFVGVLHTDIYKALKYSQKNKIDFVDVLASLEHLGGARVSKKKELNNTYRRLMSWTSVAKNKLLLDTLEIIVRESGFLNNILSSGGSIDRMKTLETFFTEAGRISEGKLDFKLANFMSHLDILSQYNIMLRKKNGEVGNGIRLMTAHKSKGLEFDHVFIIGVYHGHWGGRRSIRQFQTQNKSISLSSSGDNSDERRLFYVALTRAREGVYISYATLSEDGRSRLPSQFIEEMDRSLIDEISVLEYEKKYEGQMPERYAPQKMFGPEIDDKKYLNQLFLEQGLSVTALNNYMTCPWQYFYNNLIRIPKPYSKFQIYGSVIHKVLREVFDKAKHDKKVNKTPILSRFEEILSGHTLSTTDYKELLEKGKTALSGYFDKYHSIWHKNVFTEFKVEGVSVDVEVEDKVIKVPLKGFLDKIEILDDNEVNVVDYKTGKPKSRNAIEGNTKTSDGNYFRQLVFYKLLMDELKDSSGQTRYKMVEGVIDFVEPDQRGNYKKEKFVIKESEKEDLIADIKDVSKEILELSFWNERCKNRECEFCKIRDLTISS